MISLTTPIASSHAATPTDGLGGLSHHDLGYHDLGRHDLHRHLDAKAEDLWAETDDWRAAVEDIVDAVLLRVSAIELSKIRSSWS